MKYKAIIFDLDGVICHTDVYHYRAWKTLADRLNIYFDEVINNRLRGISRMESLEIILQGDEKKYTESEKQALAEEKNEIYVKLLAQMSEKDLSKEVRDTLFELKNKGLLLTIGSSSRNTKLILRQIGLDNFFDAVSDGNNIIRSKPDPEVFLKAAEFSNTEPKDCLVVEDSEAGIKAAIAANMECTAIGDGINCHKSTYEIKEFRELLQIAG